jgi:hypothetical protein
MSALNAVLAMEGVQSVNTDKGVDLTVTTDKAEEVEPLQVRVTEAVTQVQETVAAMKEGGGERLQRMGGRGGLIGTLLAGAVTMTTANLENGVVISFSSDAPDVVEQLQTGMPEWVRGSRWRTQWMATGRRLQQARQLLNNEAVTIATAEVEGGLTITVTAEAPELQAEIREVLKTYLQDTAAQAQRGGGPAGEEAGQGGQGRERRRTEAGEGRRRARER